jgi:hypothetical protein
MFTPYIIGKTKCKKNPKHKSATIAAASWYVSEALFTATVSDAAIVDDCIIDVSPADVVPEDVMTDVGVYGFLQTALTVLRS